MLTQVNDWNGGVTGLPPDVSMYIYVPDQVAAKPPILTLVHYCGGTAPAVFGQAQGGGIVRAANQYGFILVVPSSGRCWDVQSNKTRQRDGSGDSHAIRQMVKHAVDAYQGNPDRVYSTGDSSGAMMTELLLALYPDVFKAGATFAGMPAGCRGDGETGDGGGYSGACAGGNVVRSAPEWGDLVRSFHPGYAGHLPRVQLFHGDNDTTIRYANHIEAIKEWTNVLGLGAMPTASVGGVQLGNHQGTRQSWQNACGFLVLDAFTSLGGDHGPSDALFLSQFVVPFLGLDQTGLVDPEIEQCGQDGPAPNGATDAGAPGGEAALGAGGSVGVASPGLPAIPGGLGGDALGSADTAGSDEMSSSADTGPSPGMPSNGSSLGDAARAAAPVDVSDSSGCAVARGDAGVPGNRGLSLVLAVLGLAALRARRAPALSMSDGRGSRGARGRRPSAQTGLRTHPLRGPVDQGRLRHG